MKHKVTFIGAGYVGIVNALGMASRGVEVWLVDNNEERIKNLQNDIPPIYEEGIEHYFRSSTVHENMHYTVRLEEALHNTDYVFITVGTPQSPDGSADLSAVFAVAHSIGQKMDHSMTVIVKSTVPVGTTQKVENIIANELANRQVKFRENLIAEYGGSYIKDHPEIYNESPLCIDFGIADNPEFLKEGHAFTDFNYPDRIVVGTYYADDDVRIKILDLYLGMGFHEDVMFMCNIPSAELIKYASNSMLATRISFANMMADICTVTGADVEDVMTGMGMDKRIGHAFLKPGIGYGGSCFPKDIASLCHQMLNSGIDGYLYEKSLLEAVRHINYNAKQRPFNFLRAHLDSLEGKTVAVWGAAFKEGTDDIRESPFLDLIHDTCAYDHVTYKVYDKLAKENLCRFLADPANQDDYVGHNEIIVVDSILDSVEGADAIILMTPVQRYKSIDFGVMREHTGKEHPYFYDCRNFYDIDDVTNIINAGFRYSSVGRQFSWLSPSGKNNIV
jgi:UDPglucose 6-dehydrogenase